MKFKSILPVFAAMASFVMLSASCKKESTYEELPDLAGQLKFSLPAFAKPGDEFILTPSGAYHPEKGDFGYYWTATKITTKNDTTKRLDQPLSTHDGSYKLVIKDSLYTITVKCYMFATGYNSMATTHDVTVVKPTSVTNILQVEGEKSFTDERDGNVYTYVTADGLDWMNTNLRYAAAGKPYSDCEPMTELFGNLYTWEDAKNSCPDGWRLPSEDEWKALCGGDFKGVSGKLMVDAYFNGEKMWEYWPKVNITNAYGMNFIPAGYAVVEGRSWKFDGRNGYASAWTSDESEEDLARYISIYMDEPDVLPGDASKEYFAASVRCVR